VLYDIQSEIKLTLSHLAFELSNSGLTVAPSKLSETVTLLTCIQGVPDLNLGHDTNYPDSFFWFSLVPPRKCLDSTLKQAMTTPVHIPSTASLNDKYKQINKI
jgi:hypothetical protein